MSLTIVKGLSRQSLGCEEIPRFYVIGRSITVFICVGTGLIVLFSIEQGYVAVTLQTCILEVLGLNLYGHVDYPD
jgi:hypothetical protein